MDVLGVAAQGAQGAGDGLIQLPVAEVGLAQVVDGSSEMGPAPQERFGFLTGLGMEIACQEGLNLFVEDGTLHGISARQIEESQVAVHDRLKARRNVPRLRSPWMIRPAPQVLSNGPQRQGRAPVEKVGARQHQRESRGVGTDSQQALARALIGEVVAEVMVDVGQEVKHFLGVWIFPIQFFQLLPRLGQLAAVYELMNLVELFFELTREIGSGLFSRTPFLFPGHDGRLLPVVDMADDRNARWQIQYSFGSRPLPSRCASVC